MSSRATLWSAVIPGTLAVVFAGWLIACGSDSKSNNPGGGTADGGGSADGGEPTPEQQFRALEPDLTAKCGGANGVCHVIGSFSHAPTWLAKPDAYVSAKAYKGIIPVSGDSGDSILLTQAEHEGPSLQTFPDLFGKVRAWITAEVGAKKLPETDPFPVIDGDNSIDLSKLGSGFPGAKLTFVAQTNNDILTLSSMKIYSATTVGVHVDSPFFVIVPKTGPVIADPVTNGFTGTQDIAKATSQDFYSGQIILLKWASTSQLRVAFKAFGPIVQNVDAGPSGACTNLPSFIANAKPAFNASLALPEGGTGSCDSCHNGGDEVARNAMDLTALGTDDATACAQARNYINFADKPASRLITNPQGLGNMQHPISSLQATDPIVLGIKQWVTDESQ
jgi:hypothetical protein